MQERLRGNAADVEANAAERRAPVDEHDLLPKVGRAERRRVAARSGAEHQNFRLEVGRRSGRRRRLSDRWWGRKGRRRGRLFGRRACVGRKQAPLAHPVANLDKDLADHAVFGRGNVEGRLVAFERQQRRLFPDRLSGSDEDFDDRHVFEVADVGQADFVRHGSSASCQRMTRRMSSTTPARCRMKRAAAAPSITR